MSTLTTARITTSAARPTAARTVRTRRDDEAVSRLVRRAAAGEQQAWDDLVDEFGALVWSAARACGVSEADAADVSQITWLRLVGHLDRLRDPARVGAWLATTARRQCSQLRGTRQAIPLGDDLPEPVGNEPAACDVLLADERDRALGAAVNDLPERDRALLRMLMADPTPSYAEIGAALGMPIGSIGPTRARVLQRLRVAAHRRGLDDDSW